MWWISGIISWACYSRLLSPLHPGPHAAVKLWNCSPLLQNYNVTWILTQPKDSGTSTNNQSHYFRKQRRFPSSHIRIRIQFLSKSPGDLDNLPVASLVPPAFMFYNQCCGSSSTLLASGSYVRQSNQRIAAVEMRPIQTGRMVTVQEPLCMW